MPSDLMPVASLPTKFRMPDIERYTGIGCPRIHLRLYSTVMRAHGLDEPQMITLFPLSLSGAAQRWFTSLESSRCRTWDDLAQEFLRQFSFNTVVDVLRKELEALRQRAEESVSSFISRWCGKIAEIIDRPSERDQIQMVLRSLQLRIARHVVGVPFADFGSLVMALYDVEDGISRGLWADSSPSDLRGRNHSYDRGRQMLVLSVHPVRGFLGVISRSHNSSRLIRLTHLSSSGHGHLARLLIRHIRLSHWLYLTMSLRALRGLLFHTRPLDSHVTLHSSLRGPHLHTLGLKLSRPLHPLL